MADEAHKNEIEAYRRYEAGEKPYYSTSFFTEEITAGYGFLDDFGEWEFPLNVDQDSFEIIPLEN